MKKIMLFVLALCLCFTTFGAAFAETSQTETTGTEASATEAPATEKPAVKMTAEELFQAGLDALNAQDYGKMAEILQMAADAGYTEAWGVLGDLYLEGAGVEQD